MEIHFHRINSTQWIFFKSKNNNENLDKTDFCAIRDRCVNRNNILSNAFLNVILYELHVRSQSMTANAELFLKNEVDATDNS